MRRQLLPGAVTALACFVLADAAQAQRPRPQKAVFDVVVEGTGAARQVVDVEGTNGACTVRSHTESNETYEYGRGKGVRVVFTRFRGVPDSPVLLTRVGRRTGAAFNVRGSFKGTASGTATREGPPEACLPATENVGDETQCNKKLGRAVDMALGYAEGDLGLEVSGDAIPRLPGSGCGSNTIETLSGAPLFGWEGFPDLKPKALAPSRIFGRKSAFLVRLGGDGRLQTDSPNPAFPGRAFNTGRHDAVVRFVRVDR
jgi:hypothetical protein